MLQVAEALRVIHGEGIHAVHDRHRALADRLRRGARELGLALLFPRLCNFSWTLTALRAPEYARPSDIRDRVKARGILCAAALGRYVNEGFRVGHMGDIR